MQGSNDNMSNLVTKIEAFLLQEPLDNLCGASAFTWVCERYSRLCSKFVPIKNRRNRMKKQSLGSTVSG